MGHKWKLTPTASAAPGESHQRAPGVLAHRPCGGSQRVSTHKAHVSGLCLWGYTMIPSGNLT